MKQTTNKQYETVAVAATVYGFVYEKTIRIEKKHKNMCVLNN